MFVLDHRGFGDDEGPGHDVVLVRFDLPSGNLRGMHKRPSSCGVGSVIGIRVAELHAILVLAFFRKGGIVGADSEY